MTEKWNIEIKHTPDSRKDLADDKSSELIKRNARFEDGFQVAEFEKNEMEIEVISSLNSAAQGFLKKQGLPPLSVDEKFVHILSKEDFEKQRDLILPGCNSEALFHGGHVYHPRTENKIVLARNLAHEFAHELSFLKKEVELSAEDGKLFINYCGEKRRGYGVRTKRSGTIGQGFYEAMTELAALEIMKEYAYDNNLNEDEYNDLFYMISYYPQILVLENLFEKIYPGEPEKGRTLLFRSYFTGSQEALKKISSYFIESGIKDGLKTLFHMDTSLKSALDAAKYLNLEEAVKDIEEFVYEKKS